MAFHRYFVRLNSGITGPRGITGFQPRGQHRERATDAAVLALTRFRRTTGVRRRRCMGYPVKWLRQQGPRSRSQRLRSIPTAARRLSRSHRRLSKLRRAAAHRPAPMPSSRVEDIMNSDPADGLFSITIAYRLQASPGTLGTPTAGDRPRPSARHRGQHQPRHPGTVVSAPTAPRDCGWDFEGRPRLHPRG